MIEALDLILAVIGTGLLLKAGLILVALVRYVNERG